jgi:hypothetical protein
MATTAAAGGMLRAHQFASCCLAQRPILWYCTAAPFCVAECVLAPIARVCMWFLLARGLIVQMWRGCSVGHLHDTAAERLRSVAFKGTPVALLRSVRACLSRFTLLSACDRREKENMVGRTIHLLATYCQSGSMSAHLSFVHGLPQCSTLFCHVCAHRCLPTSGTASMWNGSLSVATAIVSNTSTGHLALWREEQQLKNLHVVVCSFPPQTMWRNPIRCRSFLLVSPKAWHSRSTSYTQQVSSKDNCTSAPVAWADMPQRAAMHFCIQRPNMLQCITAVQGSSPA